jgi:hypothetical protein
MPAEAAATECPETLTLNISLPARERAVYLLHIGAEVEHALMAQYLYAALSLPKTLSAHTNALIGKLIADRDQLEAAESKIGKCKRGRCRGRKCGLGPREFALAHQTREES